MRGYNRVIIAGNLTRDPEVRATINKRTYARFSVAVNSAWRNQNGELQERVEYINVIVWGQMADTCGKYLRKGRGVLIEGRLQTSTYEARDGTGKRTITDVVADTVQFLNSGQQNPGGGGNPWQNNNDNSYQPQTRQPAQNQPNNWRNKNYDQTPVFEPPTDEDFGNPIGESGFENFAPPSDIDFAGGNENDTVPF